MEELPQAWVEEQALCTWEVSSTSLSGIRVLLYFFIFYSVIYSYSNLTMYTTTDVYNFFDWGNIEGKSVNQYRPDSIHGTANWCRCYGEQY